MTATTFLWRSAFSKFRFWKNLGVLWMRYQYALGCSKWGISTLSRACPVYYFISNHYRHKVGIPKKRTKQNITQLTELFFKILTYRHDQFKKKKLENAVIKKMLTSVENNRHFLHPDLEDKSETMIKLLIFFFGFKQCLRFTGDSDQWATPFITTRMKIIL